MHEIHIGLLGLGTVGSGVIQILDQNAKDIENRSQTRIKVTKVLVRNLNMPRAITGDFLVTDNPQDILSDSDIDIIVEAIGGIEPARTYILEAFKYGKNVVTANKDLLALYGHELLEAAKLAKKDLYFEASVAGGIPIIAALKQSLAGNRIAEVLGIINGTTNYILTAMSDQGRDYEEVLKEAQHLGYAEANPSADVDGLDAARKLAILSSIAFNSRVTINDVYIEGISKITPEDIAYARELDSTIKLLAVAKAQEDGIEIRVHMPYCRKLTPWPRSVVFLTQSMSLEMPSEKPCFMDVVQAPYPLRVLSFLISYKWFETSRPIRLPLLTAPVTMNSRSRPNKISEVPSIFD
jgi:homoserine dehydrogenase